MFFGMAEMLFGIKNIFGKRSTTFPSIFEIFRRYKAVLKETFLNAKLAKNFRKRKFDVGKGRNGNSVGETLRPLAVSLRSLRLDRVLRLPLI
jgi:hypothetical protein